MPFAIPTIWREPRDHHADCYFCSVNMTGFSAKKKHNIVYSVMDSTRRPVKHCEELPIPIPPDDGVDSIEDEVNSDEGATSSIPRPSADHDYTLEGRNFKPKLLTQGQLNDLLETYHFLKRKQSFLPQDYRRKTYLTKMFVSVTAESGIIT